MFEYLQNHINRSFFRKATQIQIYFILNINKRPVEQQKIKMIVVYCRFKKQQK